MNINKEVIMEKRWNLDQLYLSFQDQSFLNDIETLKQMLEDMQEYSQKEKTEDNLKSYLEQSNQFSDLVEKIYAFISLTMSSDTTNQDALKYSSVIENLLASFADAQAKIDRWIGQFDLDHIQDSYIQEHLFVLKETQEQVKSFRRNLLLFEIADMIESNSFSREEEADILSSYKITSDEIDTIFLDLYGQYDGKVLMGGKEEKLARKRQLNDIIKKWYYLGQKDRENAIKNYNITEEELGNIQDISNKMIRYKNIVTTKREEKTMEK